MVHFVAMSSEGSVSVVDSVREDVTPPVSKLPELEPDPHSVDSEVGISWVEIMHVPR